MTDAIQNEIQLVSLAKAGDVAARDQLFLACQDEIKKAVTFSALGTHPRKFGKGYNAKGQTYEEVSGWAFEVFLEALETFDYGHVDFDKFSRTTPFLSYVKYLLDFRAFDKVRRRSSREDRHVALDYLGEQEGSYLYGEHIVALEKRDVLRKVVSRLPSETREAQALRLLVENAAEGERCSIQLVVDALGVTKPTAYKVVRLAVDRLPAELAQDFREILAAA